MSAGIIKTDISDHFPIFLVDNGCNLTAFPRKLIKAIIIINEAFKTEHISRNWDFVTLCQSVDASYDSFIVEFQGVGSVKCKIFSFKFQELTMT